VVAAAVSLLQAAVRDPAPQIGIVVQRSDELLDLLVPSRARAALELVPDEEVLHVRLPLTDFRPSALPARHGISLHAGPRSRRSSWLGGPAASGQPARPGFPCLCAARRRARPAHRPCRAAGLRRAALASRPRG